MASDLKRTNQQKNEKDNVSVIDKEEDDEAITKEQSPSSKSSPSSGLVQNNKKSTKRDTKNEDSSQVKTDIPGKPLPFVSDIASGASSLKKRPVKRTVSTPDKDKNDDPHNITRRFVDNHLIFFPAAHREICSGAKQSCWMWFILPTPPHVVNGIERGSSMNRRFALRGDEAVDAYLDFKRWVPFPKDRYADFYDPYANPYGSEGDDDHDDDEKEEGQEVDLRQNYIDMLSAVHRQLLRGNNMTSLFGPLDDVKAISSFKFFEGAGVRRNDNELSSLCRKVLDLAESGITSKKKKRKGPMLKYLSNRQNSY